MPSLGTCSKGPACGVAWDALCLAFGAGGRCSKRKAARPVRRRLHSWSPPCAGVARVSIHPHPPATPPAGLSDLRRLPWEAGPGLGPRQPGSAMTQPQGLRKGPVVVK